MERSIFINLAVRDLEQSADFFAQLGFEFDEPFSDETSACVIIDENIRVMLLTKEKFGTYTPNKICNSRKKTEVLLCITCDSRDEVDELVERAVRAGGTTFNDPADHGFMYGHAFQDLDGHIWELVHFVPTLVEDDDF